MRVLLNFDCPNDVHKILQNNNDYHIRVSSNECNLNQSSISQTVCQPSVVLYRRPNHGGTVGVIRVPHEQEIMLIALVMIAR